MTGLLDWADDEDGIFGDHDGVVVAWFGNRTYYIWPERRGDAGIVGYRIMAGHFEGEHMPLGSLEIDGEPGERTLEGAKAAADAEATALFNEQQLALVAVATKWTDDAGDSLVRVDGMQIFYRIGTTADAEVEVIAGPNFEDWFDVRGRQWFVGQDSLVNNPERLESLLDNVIAAHAADLGISEQHE